MKSKISLLELKLNDGTHGLPKNPRFIKDERFKKLCESIRDFPEAMPARGIVVDERGIILGGNMRYRACLANGTKEIPVSWVHRLTGLTTEQKRRFIIMDNRPYGEDDFDLLGNEWDIDELLKGGFDEKDLEGLIEDEPQDAEAQIDRAAELNKVWKVKTGDLWQIGSHRLLCGDSTKKEDVDRLMECDVADTLITSPPYWANQEYDSKIGIDAARLFMRSIAVAWKDHIRRRIIINTGYTNEKSISDNGRGGVRIMLDWEWARAWGENGWELRHRRVWVKGGGSMNMSPASDMVDESCEMLMTFFRPGHNEGGQERTNATWCQNGYWSDIPGVGKNITTGHPCPFSSEIPGRFIQLYSKKGGVIADPFIGSGSSMVAAQNLGRKCRGIEISPDYCAVILQRMFDAFPGIKIERVK